MGEWPYASAPWLTQLLGNADQPAPPTGVEVVTTGSRAVVAVESLVSRKICYPSRPAEAGLVNTSATVEQRSVQAGRAVSLEEVYFNGPREAIAALNGLAVTGLRATALVSGHRLAEVLDLLVMSAGRHVPLVLHAVNRTMHRQTTALGSGHDGYHAAADSGLFLAMARNHQEAVDLTLVARAAAERSLVPGLVAQDDLETAFSARNVDLPAVSLVQAYLGYPDDLIASPTPAQRVIFGEKRPLAPRLYNLDRPTAQGAIQGSHDYAASQAGRQPFIHDHLPALLQERIDRFNELTGRNLGMVSEYRMRDAKFALVLQGSGIGTAEAVADHLRATRGIKVGVLGITFFRPFALDTVRRALKGVKAVSVLERLDPALAQDPPLLREVRAALAGAGPHLISVAYGTGGELLTAAQLVAVCENMNAGRSARDRISLILDPIATRSAFPKREILLQEVRKDYPDLESVVAPRAQAVDLRPSQARTVTLFTRELDHPEDVLIRVADAMPGTSVRSRSSIPEFGCWVGRVTCAPEPFPYPGDATPVDVALIGRINLPGYVNPVAEVVRGGAVVVASAATGRDLWGRLPAGWRDDIRAKEIRLYRTAAGIDGLIQAAADVFADRTDALDTVDWRAMDDAAVDGRMKPEIPMIIRLRDRQEPTYDNIARFWSQVVQPRLEGESPREVPDPGLTFGAIPASSSTFNDRTEDRTQVPVFDPTACTGCGACWTSCPDSAIGAVALGAEALLNAAAGGVESPNEQAGPLQRAHRQLAARIDMLLHNDGATAFSTDRFDQAGEWLIEKMPVAEADQAAFREALADERRVIEGLSWSVTDALFHDAHREKKGSGALLSLAFSAQACQGCGLCAAVCPDQAIAMVDQSPERVLSMRRAWRTWEQLPDTPGDLIARLSTHPAMNPLAATLLSRHCLLAVAGGDGAEPGSGERIALRQVAAAVEYRMQHLMKKRAARFAELAQSLRARIREVLAASLSIEDLEALERSLARSGRRYADVSDITSALDDLGQTSRVDRQAVYQMTHLARQLEHGHWLLTEGPTGAGRARFSLVAPADSVGDWARYPYNPFAIPLTVDPEGDGIALGILQGHLAELVDQHRLIRRAELALDPPRDRIPREQALQSLTWQDLPEDELAACPPVLYVAGRDHGNLARLLASGLPVRIILLDGYEELSDVGDPALVAVAMRRMHVLSSSIAHPGHLFDGVQAALAGAAPSLVRVYAPSPTRHGFPPHATVERAREAVNARMHLLFDSRPGPHGVDLRLEGNPMVDQDWNRDEAQSPLLPAHWALGESRFAQALQPRPADDPRPTVPLLDWLALDGPARAARTPVIQGPDGGLFAVGPLLTRAVENRLAAWTYLRDLERSAGEGAEAFRRRLLHDSERAHQEEIARLKREFEAQLRDLEAGQREGQSKLLKDRLMRLSGITTRPGPAPEGSGE